MIRPQYSLRALVGLLSLAACLFGMGVPAYRQYQRYVLLAMIRVEVEDCLADARSQMIDNPWSAMEDVKVLQESVQRAPILNDGERPEFEPEFERILKECARRIEVHESERWRYACGVRLNDTRESASECVTTTSDLHAANR